MTEQHITFAWTPTVTPTEYRITWAPTPTSREYARVLFVEAESDEAARKFATDHLERTQGRHISIFDCQPYTRPASGKVIA